MVSLNEAKAMNRCCHGKEENSKGKAMVEKRPHALKRTFTSETPPYTLPWNPDYETRLESNQSPNLHPLRPLTCVANE